MKNFRKSKIAFAAVFAAVLLIAGFAYENRGTLASWGFDVFLSKKVEAKLADSYKPLEGRTPPAAAEAETKIEKPFSMLLMGVDAREHERGRSDTLIYTVVRPADGHVLMISIPRDTYTEIVGKDIRDKITHAYAYGGPEMAVGTVEKLLDAKIDHYASINFQGFEKAVDLLGGIPLPIPKDIVNKGADHEKFTIKANQPVYNGRDALNFVRYREDAGGDMSRTERNRQFLEALMHKASSMGQWAKIPDIVDVVGDNFRTDILPSALTDLAKKFLQSNHQIVSYTLQGEGKRMGEENLWYYVADEADLAAVRGTIAEWLNPDTPAAALAAPSPAKSGAPSSQT